MNLRPRCRDWLPLSTQQLRLRNLVRIKGVNIKVNTKEDGKEILLYYTLHSCKDSEQFYTSEALPQRHLQQKWVDIECDEMLKSNANCVCIKVWMRYNIGNDYEKHDNKPTQNSTTQTKLPMDALRQHTNTCLSPYKLPRPPDTLLFCWAVYFSGLILLSHENVKCKPNSLIFCLNDALFASPKHLTLESLGEQLSFSYRLNSSRLPQMSAERLNECYINSPPVSRSSSPSEFHRETHLVTLLRTRYIQLSSFLFSRKRSYNLQDLLILQQFQRSNLQLSKESHNLVEEIKYLSLHCITTKELSKKPRTSSLTNHHSHHSMGRTLSNLLAEQQQIDPKTLYRGKQLMSEIESLKCRKKLLQTEYETMKVKIKIKEKILTEIVDRRVKLQNWLQKRFLQLHEECCLMPAFYKDYDEKKLKKRQMMQNVERSRIALCLELSEIYPIGHNGSAHTICGIPFPCFEAFLDNNKFMNSISAGNIPPTALNAAFGYVAHLIQMIAVIMNRPLRNPIIYEGSRTRIKDVINNIPYTSREYPLYTRSVLPSQAVRYAAILLTENIFQLCFDITKEHLEKSSAIENVLRIFARLAEIHRNQHDFGHSALHLNPAKFLLHVNDNKIQENGNHKDLQAEFIATSNESMNLNEGAMPSQKLQTTKLSPFYQLLPSSSSPLPILNSNNITHQRICRSVGSYSDSEEDVSNLDQFYSNSDSNLTFQADD